MRVPETWVLASPWVIKEAGTRKFFIQRHCRSNTHYDPEEIREGDYATFPLFFRSERHAQNFLRQWRRGRMHADSDGYQTVYAVPDRLTKQFEILQLRLVREP